MPSKVVVHSNGKQLIQVIALTVLIASALIGLKQLARKMNQPSVSASEPAQVSSLVTTAGPGPIDQIISGRSSVVDADTLDIHGIRVRLEGIDAPESRQRCGAPGEEWACGQQAALALSDWLGSRTVDCHVHGADRYSRQLVRCFAGSEDVQSWLVSQGWAMAYRQYSQDYVAAEENAALRKAGIWRGPFIPPWEWRQR